LLPIPHHSTSTPLFLRILLIRLRLRALGPHTHKPGLRARRTERLIRALRLLDVADLRLGELDSVGDGQDGREGRKRLALLGGLDVGSRRVARLGLAVAAGEEDEALLVLLQALDVGF